MQAPHGVHVAGREQRAGPTLGRVPHRPQAGAVRDAEARLDGARDPVVARRLLDEADRHFERPDRVLLQPEGQGEMEHDLRVRRALDLGEQGRIDGEHEIPPENVEAGDEAVVHEKPAAVTERVAVGLLHGRADRGADMRHEQL
jgi:hypothetical protein